MTSDLAKFVQDVFEYLGGLFGHPGPLGRELHLLELLGDVDGRHLPQRLRVRDL